MSEVTIIGIDLAKRVFQLHGARHSGSLPPPLSLYSVAVEFVF